MEVLARGRLPGPVRRFVDRELMQYLHWGTSGPMWHLVVFVASLVGCAGGGTLLIRRAAQSGVGRHRRALTKDASGRLQVDRELEERALRQQSSADSTTAD